MKLLANYLFTKLTGPNIFRFSSHGKSFLFKIYFTHVSLKIKYIIGNIMWKGCSSQRSLSLRFGPVKGDKVKIVAQTHQRVWVLLTQKKPNLLHPEIGGIQFLESSSLVHFVGFSIIVSFLSFFLLVSPRQDSPTLVVYLF